MLLKSRASLFGRCKREKRAEEITLAMFFSLIGLEKESERMIFCGSILNISSSERHCSGMKRILIKLDIKILFNAVSFLIISPLIMLPVRERSVVVMNTSRKSFLSRGPMSFLNVSPLLFFCIALIKIRDIGYAIINLK